MRDTIEYNIYDLAERYDNLLTIATASVFANIIITLAFICLAFNRNSYHER